MLSKIKNFLKKYGAYILPAVCLIIGILSLKFRNSTLDDDLYLFETSIMSDVLKRGEWIGNYGVGVHGFLFKLPIAFVFLLTGSVMNIAVVWNILIACASLYLFYLVLKEIFKKDLVALSGTLLLFTNFQFFLNLPTYMREMPVIFALLLFVYLLVKKKSYWVIGLSLLLVLDAKESVFFMILPGYLLSILINEWGGFNIKTLWIYIKSYFQILLPSLILLLLMLFTQLIPLNTVIFTLIPGVTEGGVEYQMKHFEKEAATQNIVQIHNLEAANVNTLLIKDQKQIEEKAQKIIKTEEKFFSKTLNTIKGYIGKILYPRTFSFLSIPGMIFFPALFTSFLMFRYAVNKRKKECITLAFIMWAFIIVYILRLSFDRYLFPITPIVIYFFLLFLKDISKNKKQYLAIWVLASILSLAGLLFEAEYIMIKFVLSAIIITLLPFHLLLKDRVKAAYLYLCICIGILTLGVSLFYYYSSGQLKMYRQFGNDYEVKDIVTHFSKDEKILLNDIGWDLLPGIYRGNNQYNPEWKWELKDWVPRKKYLKMLDTTNTFLIMGESIEDDRIDIEKYGISKVGVVKSKIGNKPFLHQDRVEEYMKVDWLRFVGKKDFKNKELYIFEVI